MYKTAPMARKGPNGTANLRSFCAISISVTPTRVPVTELTKMVKKELDLRPSPVIEQLDLLRPIYKKTACYGHFGRELEEFTWEKTDLVEKLKKAI